MSKKNPKTQVVNIRFSEYEKNKIQMLANVYANGNLSKWLTYAGLNAPRKYLTK